MTHRTVHAVRWLVTLTRDDDLMPLLVCQRCGHPLTQLTPIFAETLDMSCVDLHVMVLDHMGSCPGVRGTS